MPDRVYLRGFLLRLGTHAIPRVESGCVYSYDMAGAGKILFLILRFYI